MSEPSTGDMPAWLQGPEGHALLDAGQPRFLPALSTLCEEGQTLDRVFLVTSGAFEIAKYIGGQQHSLSTCGPGTLLALMPALDGEPCAVSISAREDATVVEIKRESLLALIDLDGNPERVPIPSRDASLPAEPAGSARDQSSGSSPAIGTRLSLLAIRRLRNATNELAQALHCALRSPEQNGRVDAMRLARIQARGYAWLDF